MAPLSLNPPGLYASTEASHGAAMLSSEFINLIRGLCASVGIADWQEVVATGHVVVDGIMVGLSFGDGAQARSQLRHPSDHLTLYFDLGVVPLDGLECKLLRINGSDGVGSEECFALLPRTDSVVYRVHLALLPHEPAIDLAHWIGVYLERGRTRLRNLLMAELPPPMPYAAQQAAAHGLHPQSRTLP